MLIFRLITWQCFIHLLLEYLFLSKFPDVKITYVSRRMSLVLLLTNILKVRRVKSRANFYIRQLIVTLVHFLSLRISLLIYAQCNSPRFI